MTDADPPAPADRDAAPEDRTPPGPPPPLPPPAAPRRHPRLRFLAVVVLAVAGAGAGLLVAGRAQHPVGPFDATLSLQADPLGDTVVRLAPLGSLRLDTHDGPVGLEVRADELRTESARSVVAEPDRLSALADTATADLRHAVRTVALRALLGALIGALAGALIREWSLRSLAVAVVAAALVSAATGAWARLSWDQDAVAEPRYTGLLTVAPRAIGSVRDIQARFDAYREQLVRLIDNVAGLYQAASTLESFEPDAGTVRVLHVSDLHLNPQGFDLIAKVSREFKVDAVVDTGDLLDWGTQLEGQFTEAIGRLQVPYVYVRGNHDSAATAQAVGGQPNAVVLENSAAEVKGIRFWGIGDPRFTPDKSTGDDEADDQARLMSAFAAALPPAVPAGTDVVVVHDPAAAAQLGGRAPLVLAGHQHRTAARRLTAPTTTTTTVEDGDAGDEEDGTEPAEEDVASRTLLLVEGSTGGAGLRALEGEEPEPLTATVLYFDVTTRRLVAYDRITVSGLGGAEVNIARRLVPAPAGGTTPTTSTTPATPTSAPPTTPPGPTTTVTATTRP